MTPPVPDPGRARPLLFDTHALIWYLEDDPKLPADLLSLNDGPSRAPLFSIVSWWEMAIKVSIGKLRLSMPLPEAYAQVKAFGFQEVPLRIEHVLRTAQLPYHHNDPFDRLLIAQALVENYTLGSVDRHFDAYGVRRRW